MKSRLALCISILCCIQAIQAQSLYQVSLDEKTANSSLIIEGKVVEQNSFWNSAHTMIYTSSKVEVYKIFKGSISQPVIEIMTMGGTVAGDGVEVTDVLKLGQDDVGTFFLSPNKMRLQSPATRQSLWDVYSSSQGFIRYDLSKEAASAPFVQYRNISNEFYKLLTVKTRRNFENKKPSFSVAALSRNNTRELTTLAPVITAFSPATVNGGSLLDPVNNLLTIDGSGFGTGSGTAAVLFDNPDDGAGGTPFAVAYNDPLIVSWTDTQIKIRVPTSAGTGALIVRDGGGVTATAAGTLSVLYTIQTSGSHETTLINANGSGGYTIFYSTNTAGRGINFDTDPAKATFQRALNTWKETVGANIVEGGTTTVQAVASDGICTIMFDNDNTGIGPLSSGVLAVCLSWYSNCLVSPATNQSRKKEFEVIIRSPVVSAGPATSFTIGPCPPNSSSTSDLDLETVILHELGHALNLGHIIDSYQGGVVGKINPNKLMNYALVNSVRRITPDYSAKMAALYAITPQGAITGSCLSNGEMTPLTAITEARDECPATFPVTATPPGTVINFDLAHATSNRFVDPGYTQIRCGSSNGSAITNNAYYVFRTTASGLLSMSISGYTTTPASIAACTPLTASVPATGVRLVVYQVSSCPAAGAFPTPFACRSITANGPLSDILGLSANSNYLIYLEGYENTKAAFSITMGGTVLPIKFESFTGETLTDMNKLSWVIDYSLNVKELVLEKSSDGITYQPVDSTDGNHLPVSDFYNDTRPFSGKNFYRLAVINTDGSTEYSSIVLLARNDQFLVSVYPNPATSDLNIEINTRINGRFNFELYSAAGQLMHRQSEDIKAPRQSVKLPVVQLANGSYFLRILNDNHETLKTIPVAVRK